MVCQGRFWETTVKPNPSSSPVERVGVRSSFRSLERGKMLSCHSRFIQLVKRFQSSFLSSTGLKFYFPLPSHRSCLWKTVVTYSDLCVFNWSVVRILYPLSPQYITQVPPPSYYDVPPTLEHETSISLPLHFRSKRCNIETLEHVQWI